MDTYRRHPGVIMLSGDQGRKIFDAIKNAPPTSHAELEADVAASKKRILEYRRNNPV